MKVGIIVFPGTDGDGDLLRIVRDVMHLEAEILFHKTADLSGYSVDDLIFVPGGSSYGDALRPGALAKFSPIMKYLKAFAEAGGTVIGICNGFQILCEAGLLEGVLLKNIGGHYLSQNIYLRVENDSSALTYNLEKGDVLKIPISHGDGRYYAEPETLNALKEEGRILFTYCDEDGNLTEDANINGSELHIASICNKQGNVYGILPHPERAAEEILGNAEGKLIFESIASKLMGTVKA